MAANFIMLNNIQVAILAFALGILFGVPTLLVLVENGINIGVVAAMVHQWGEDDAGTDRDLERALRDG